MARIVGIDYGGKRCGLAVTDLLQIIATPLDTVATQDLSEFLKQYCSTEEVEAFVIGKPINLDGSETDASLPVQQFGAQLRLLFPDKPIYFTDERYTSKMAMQSMVAGGVKKNDRRKKENVDKIAATLILQHFMSGRR